MNESNSPSLTELTRRLDNLIRLGVIHSVDYAKAVARVQSGEIITNWLPFASFRAGSTQTWSPPTVGEQCVIFAISGDLATAFILTGLYTQNAPSQSQDEHVIQFADGAKIIYNQASSDLQVTGIKTATIQASASITCSTPKTICSQDLEVGGNVLVKGSMTTQGNSTMQGSIQAKGKISSEADVQAAGVSLKNHQHRGDSGGNTSTPI